ncbi:hypothetical protein DM860_013458 [Cuscuta australis]|uniref:Uncharacterized protein n=1 Tax=Cuscuta australis TaxID=267555 RepID=A0A328CZ58_9ASTE|nr:hypothetical protein DM860_013458 [Cuscuta australis]
MTSDYESEVSDCLPTRFCLNLFLISGEFKVDGLPFVRLSGTGQRQIVADGGSARCLELWSRGKVGLLGSLPRVVEFKEANDV